MYRIIIIIIIIAITTLLVCDNSDKGNVKGNSNVNGNVKGNVNNKLPDTIKLAFYNVENLFDFNLDGTEYDDYKPGWHGWSAEMQKARVKSTAEAVAAIDADVIGLCEVENSNTLLELADALDKMGAPYSYATAADAPGSATVTAILSKLPIAEKRAFPVEKSRSILEAVIASGGDTLRVFVNHWPSKRHPESARVAAAQTLRRRLDSLKTDADYIVMGDLNSNYDEYASFHTSGHDDTQGKTGINHTMKTVAGGENPKAPARFVCPGELPSCGGCHYNPWLDVEEGARMSYVYKGAKNTIDNMLLPASLFDGAGYSYLRGSFQAFTWDGRLLKDGVPYRRQMYYKGKERYHKADGYSDHLPITAKLVRSELVRDTADAPCADINPSAAIGDFAASTDGWLSGDSRFSVERDGKHAKTGSHSLKISGLHESENHTAAKATLTSAPSQKFLTLNIRGEGKLSIRLRRPQEKWVYHNAPDFAQKKTAGYNAWKSDKWIALKLPLPPPPPPAQLQGVSSINNNDNDVEVEIRAGKGDNFLVWIDRVRLE
jgi:endonuclease/exonuclease/phosphatase family metal-dependent hydrolase